MEHLILPDLHREGKSGDVTAGEQVFGDHQDHGTSVTGPVSRRLLSAVVHDEDEGRYRAFAFALEHSCTRRRAQ